MEIVKNYLIVNQKEESANYLPNFLKQIIPDAGRGSGFDRIRVHNTGYMSLSAVKKPS